MELRDLIVTPLVILIVIIVAYIVRPYATNATTKRYFFPAIMLKVTGAIALGLVYQFYYHGGDTYNFHTHGSRIIWEAFNDNPEVGLKLLFANGNIVQGAYQYSARILFYHDPASFEVIRVASFFDLFTFSSYSATAILFSIISFCGSWAMFNTFYRRYPDLHLSIAAAVLFIPSVIFWGSGLLKDTLVLAALGFSVYCIDKIFIRHKFSISAVFLLLFSLYVVFVIRKFMLEVFIPSVVLWMYFKNLVAIPSAAIRFLIAPFIIVVFVVTAYFSVINVAAGDKKYSTENIAKTAQVTAYDIRYWTGKDAGSGYSLGELDGTFGSMVKLAPAAINVSLYRPYLWEVKNPFMALSAIESFVFLVITIYIIVVGRFSLFQAVSPDIVFCLAFALSVAFGVGVSTFNFGTLVRYKIVLMPFFAVGLVLVLEKIRLMRVSGH